jgi:hypothetical protein
MDNTGLPAPNTPQWPPWLAGSSHAAQPQEAIWRSVYPPPSSLAGSHRKGHPKGPTGL